MELLETKIVSMVLLGAVSLLIGSATWGLSNYLDVKKQGKKRTIFTSLLLCFGAGVLLATGLLHILPEAREGLQERGEELEIRWLAELCLFLGFFLVYFVEEMVHVVLHFTKHKENIHRTFSMRKSGANHEDTNGDVIDGTDNDNMNSTDENCCQNTMSCHNVMELRAADEANNTSYNPKYQVRLSMTTNTMFPNYHSPETVVDARSLDTKKNGKTPKRNSMVKTPKEPHSHVVQESNSVLKDIITVLALSFHAIFEGMAVGLESEVMDVWKMFGSIAVHKFVITFCVCVELLQSNTKTLFYFLYLSTFSLVSPLGVGIGLGISAYGGDSEDSGILVAVMQGLAGGTIIYVVMFEVLQREKSKDVAGLPQLMAIVCGFAVILVIEILGAHHHHGDEHGHDHGGHSELLHDHMNDTLDDHMDDHFHDHDDDHMHPHFFNQSKLDFVPIEDHHHDDHDHHDHIDPVTDGYQVLSH